MSVDRLIFIQLVIRLLLAPLHNENFPFQADSSDNLGVGININLGYSPKLEIIQGILL